MPQTVGLRESQEIRRNFAAAQSLSGGKTAGVHDRIIAPSIVIK
jgi:hypothetical protein